MRYLNNSGSRWIAENMQFDLYCNGELLAHKNADCFESFGNFGLYCFRYRGQRYKSFAHDTDANNAPIIHIERTDFFIRVVIPEILSRIKENGAPVGITSPDKLSATEYAWYKKQIAIAAGVKSAIQAENSAMLATLNRELLKR